MVNDDDDDVQTLENFYNEFTNNEFVIVNHALPWFLCLKSYVHVSQNY